MILALLLFAPSSAVAKDCAPRAEIMEKVKALKFQRVGLGLTDSGLLFELYSTEQGRWVVFVTTPEKLTCATGWGGGFMLEEPRQPPQI
jgi:hypothetical protein